MNASGGAVLCLGIGDADGVGEAGVRDHASSEHQIIATGGTFACEGVLNSPDVAIGDDAKAHMFFDVLDSVPVGGRLVALELGSGVDDEFGRATGFDGTSAFFGACVVADAEAHFCGDDDVGGERVSDGADDTLEGLWGVEQGGAAAVSVHGFGGAPEIDIDTEGAKFREACGIICHGCGV